LKLVLLPSLLPWFDDGAGTFCMIFQSKWPLEGDFRERQDFIAKRDETSRKLVTKRKGTMETQYNPDEPGKPTAPGQQGGQQGDRERQERERQQRERERQGGQEGGGGQQRGGQQGGGGGQQGGR
jgi:hypothetical protein